MALMMWFHRKPEKAGLLRLGAAFVYNIYLHAAEEFWHGKFDGASRQAAKYQKAGVRLFLSRKGRPRQQQGLRHGGDELMDVVDPETQEGAVAGAAEGGRTQRRPRITGKGASNSSIKNRRNVINILNGSNVLSKAIPIPPSDADDVAVEAEDGKQRTGVRGRE